MRNKYALLLLSVVLLLLPRPAARAQAPLIESPWSHLIDSLTTNLNKGFIPSGLLYDRALPLALLPAVNVARPDTVNSAYLRQAYLELYMAAYNRAAFGTAPAQYYDRADQAARHDSVPLGVLDYQFHYIDSLAVRQGLLQVQNGLLYDVPNRPRSPYLVRNLTLAAPLLDTLRQATTTFVLPPALLRGNRGRQVTGVTLDFNDGGPNRFMLPGQALPITYPTNGRKVVWFYVQFNDGYGVQLRSSLYVQAPRVAYRRSIPITLPGLEEVEAKIPFQNYDSATELFGKGEVLAVLHHPASQAQALNNQTVELRRPVIIMDGFDPLDKSELEGPGSIYELLNKQGILRLLDDDGLQRDLIILNFPFSPRRTTAGTMTSTNVDGGADYVERNAFVLVELINQLKSRLAVDPATGQPYQFAIIGPSMGGLISRYALAYMEKQKAAGTAPPTGQTPAYWEHNTATWLSFDAPHLGAVVPMADQAYLQFFQNLTAAAGTALRASLYSPAPRQMLVHHVLAPGTTPAGAPGFRDRFMLALRDNGEPGSLGYPVHLRRVAIANGRLDGRNSASTPACGTIFKMDVRLRTGYAIGATIISTLYRAFFNPFAKQVETRIAACTARYAPAAGASCQVFEGVMYYGIYGANLPFGLMNTPIYGRRIVTSSSQGSYDLAPGGWRDTQRQIERQAEADQGKTYKVDVSEVTPTHAFIPTVSALGFQYQATSTYQNTGSLPNPYTNLGVRNLVCNGEIPFDAFYAPSTANTEHVTLDPNPTGPGVAFLIRELTPRVAPPVLLAAPPALCPDASATFAVQAECPRAGQPGTTYTWLPGPGLQLLSGQGTPTAQVRPAAGYTGTATLQVIATRTGYAPSAPVTVAVRVGGGYVSVSGPTAPQCYFSQLTYTASSELVQQGVEWHVSLNGVPHDEYIVQDFGTSIVVQPAETGRLQVEATTSNSCSPFQAVSGYASTDIVSETRGPNGQVLYCAMMRVGTPAPVAVYPNPADDYFIVRLPAPETSSRRPAGTTQVVLYNSQGRLVRQQTALPDATELRFATADLPAGLYGLVLRTPGGKPERQNLLIEHPGGTAALR